MCKVISFHLISLCDMHTFVFAVYQVIVNFVQAVMLK